MKIARIGVGILVIGVIVGVVFGIRYWNGQGISTNDAAAMTKTKGNSQGRVQIVEYGDFQCPSCSRGAQVLKAYYEVFPQDMHVEFRQFPLNGHAHALLAAKAAECALDQKRFWEMHDQLFHEQSSWSELVSARSAFVELAKKINLNTKDFEVCLDDPAIEARVLAQRDEALSRDIRSTPSFFVNGELVVGSKSLVERLTKEFRALSEEEQKIPLVS